MSLLMDALKKAEQEKRDAARKLDEAASVSMPAAPAPGAEAPQSQPAAGEPVTGPAGSRELSLEPVSGEFAAAPAASEGAAPAETSPADEQPTLNVTGDQLYTLELSTSQPGPAPVAPIRSGLATELIDEEAFNGDRTFQGIPEAAAPRAVPGMYEETVRGDLSGPSEAPASDQTLPGVSAVQMARDIGTRDQPTPVAAETVFVAGRSREDSASGIKWILGGLTLLMLAAAGIWVYFTVTPVARSVPSPWVARGIESVPVAPQVDLPPPAGGGAELPGAAPLEEPPPVPPAAVEAQVAEAAPTPAAPVPAGEGVAAVPEPLPAEQAVPTAPTAEPGPEPVPAAPAPVAAATAPPAMAATAPSLIRISKVKGPSERERRVREAFDRYQSGDLDGARKAYLEVLADSPDNIDALLGIGAIALRRGDTAMAVEAHGRVLRLDPDNVTALAVLVGMRKNSDLSAAESAVNTLIQETPEQAFLYFTLGGIYAAQQRWPEAQQAFFDAHRIDSSNPDYALNLAVSLDRIGQSQAALDYYNTALTLGEQHAAGFDPAVVVARIQALSAEPPR